MLFNGRNLVAKCFAGFFLGKKEIVRGLKARFEFAQIIVARYEHGL
jgi:hypothetical protein